jgi:hypothetical protein
MQQITFTKNQDHRNILFDEYFTEYCTITIVAYNYDGRGNALCKCDGELTELAIETLKKIIFGTPKEAIETYLKNIYDPDPKKTLINGQGGTLLFRLPELKKLKKYDILNLAKATFKEFSSCQDETFHYFSKTANMDNAKCPKAVTTVYGNTKSNVFHKSACKSFNSISGTSLFNSHSEAVSAGFKPCRICKP